MTPLVLTLVGDDRTGLVNSVAKAVTDHGGNWEQSEISELAGKFAGLVLVSIPDDRADAFVAALEPLDGLLDVTVQRAEVDDSDSAGHRWSLSILGSDRPGIVTEITTVLADHDINIEAFTATTREAPMAGELLFEATAHVVAQPDADLDALRHALESLANELMVDIEFASGG